MSNNPWAKSDEARANMSAAANKKWQSKKGQKLKQNLSKKASIQNATAPTHKSRRRGLYPSKKIGKNVPFQSSYELKAILILEEDKNVLIYDHGHTYEINGRSRCAEFIVNNNKIIEVKPQGMINSKNLEIKSRVALQLSDGQDYCNQNNLEYEIWTEKELGFSTPHEATMWADEFMSKLHGVDYVKDRKEKSRKSTNKYYRKTIATDKVKIFCDFCNEEHEPLRLTYERNISRNGRYICEREGGSIAGSKPKPWMQKENPYANEGKKQCNKCKEIKDINEFPKDGTKRDGRGTVCKECKSKKQLETYYQNK
jgi:hypothetical protein